MQKYNINKDFRALSRLNMKLSSLSDIHARRLIGKVTTLPVHITKDLKVHHTTINGYKDQPIKLVVFDPKTHEEAVPCIFFYHGGGFMLGVNELHYRYACEYARNTNSVVIMPDYQLAPEHPYPAGVTDCFKTLEWALENSSELGIDTTRLAVVGESAGGNLAAAVALMCRDRGGPALACQVLVYPTTDNTHTTASARKFTDTPMFYSDANLFMWSQYLPADMHDVPSYAAPLHAESLRDLPPAYLETAEFDPLHDEGLAYAMRLMDHNVEVELNETKGTVHGYDAIKRSPITQDSFSRRFSFLNRHLQIRP